MEERVTELLEKEKRIIEDKDKEVDELKDRNDKLNEENNKLCQEPDRKYVIELKDLISMSIIHLERVERFDLVEKAKQLLTK